MRQSDFLFGEASIHNNSFSLLIVGKGRDEWTRGRGILYRNQREKSTIAVAIAGDTQAHASHAIHN